MYLVLCDELICRFQELEIRWRIHVNEMLTNKTSFLCEKLETERLAHAFLCNILVEVRSIFGLRLATYVFFVFQDHLMRFYFSVYLRSNTLDNPAEDENFHHWDLLFFTVHSWIGVYLIASFSEKLTLAVSKFLSNEIFYYKLKYITLNIYGYISLRGKRVSNLLKKFPFIVIYKNIITEKIKFSLKKCLRLETLKTFFINILTQ